MYLTLQTLYLHQGYLALKICLTGYKESQRDQIDHQAILPITSEETIIESLLRLPWQVYQKKISPLNLPMVS